MKKIFIIAGDTSGDLYGGYLAKKIKENSAPFQIFSCGGKVLADNSNQLIDLVSRSVCGLMEVATSLARLRRLFNKTLKMLDQIKPDLIILIDFPDFNLRLAKKINHKYPVFYYVSPQVWAWRKNRIYLMNKFTDKIIPIFKFETDFYRRNNIDTLYFGHPLLEIMSPDGSEKKDMISFMPGSRTNEIKHHLKLLARAKEILKEKLPDSNFQVLKPQGLDPSLYKKFFPEKEIIDHSYQALARSKFAICASGTATVETAILEIPHLIIYKVNSLTWYILKNLIDTKFAGMINVLAGKLIVPELLQRNANAKNIAEITLNYLRDEKAYSSFKETLKETKQLLFPQKGISGFAEYIQKYLDTKS